VPLDPLVDPIGESSEAGSTAVLFLNFDRDMDQTSTPDKADFVARYAGALVYILAVHWVDARKLVIVLQQPDTDQAGEATYTVGSNLIQTADGRQAYGNFGPIYCPVI